jgi:RNA polymerase sigma-70 factor (ECF subfamily)
MAANTLLPRVLVTPREGTSEVPARAMPAIGEVYEAQFQYVFRCLRSLGVHGDLLDDALQDVFMVVQDKLREFDGRAQLRTWLYAIVLRVARRYRARAARDSRRDSALELAGGEGGLERSLEQQERWLVAQRALAALDDDKREVFVLAQVEQMSAPEIAEITGVPINTVYSRLRAARAAFNAHARRASLARRSEGSSR